MKYVVGFSASILTFIVIIGICHVINIDHTKCEFMVGWLCCTAYFAGIELYEHLKNNDVI